MIASADRLPDSLKQRVKNIPRVYQGVETIVLAHQDTPIQPVVNSISRFKHGTPARKGAVSTDKRQLLAQVARGMGIKARHLASVLLALDQGDGVVASRNLTVSVFKRIANTGATVNGQGSVSELTTSFVFLYYFSS